MKRILGLFIVFIICANSISAQGLISVKEYLKIANTKNVILVSVRKPADYNKVHIKGAVNVDLNSLNTKEPVKGMLKSPKTVAAILGKKGINQSKKVVLYCATGVNAGRLYWVLRYLGCTNVYILNGHMKAWRAAKKPVTKVASKAKPVTFIPKVNKSINVNKAYVKSKLNSSGTILVDIRKKEDFDKGTIDKSVNLPHKMVLTEANKLKSKEALTAIFKKKGITPNKEIILYCESSARAGIIFFVLETVLKYPKVKVYDGAYNDWK